MKLFTKTKKYRLGLTLGGGGARGLAHIEFLKVLDELDIHPTVISGSSIGALIGALYASGQSGRDIENIIKDINILEVISLISSKKNSIDCILLLSSGTLIPFSVRGGL